MELGFLFDGSGQISKPNFLAQIVTAKEIVDSFNISDELARVGAAISSPNSRVLFTFDDPLTGPNRTAEAVKQLLDNTRQDQGAARLGAGIKTVDLQLFSTKGGSMNVSKVSFSYPFVRFLIDSVEKLVQRLLYLWSLIGVRIVFLPPKTQRCLMRLLKL